MRGSLPVKSSLIHSSPKITWSESVCVSVCLYDVSPADGAFVSDDLSFDLCPTVFPGHQCNSECLLVALGGSLASASTPRRAGKPKTNLDKKIETKDGSHKKKRPHFNYETATIQYYYGFSCSSQENTAVGSLIFEYGGGISCSLIFRRHRDKEEEEEELLPTNLSQ